MAKGVSGGMLITPGFRWKFREYAGSFFGKPQESIAKVSGVSDAYSTYVMLNGGKIYEIKVKGEVGAVHRLIVFSMTVKE